MLVVDRQREPARRVLADKVGNRVADTVDTLAVDMGMPLADAVVDMLVAAHKLLGRQRASQVAVLQPLGSGAMCSRSSNSEQTYPSRPIDRERCYSVLHSLGRK